MRSSCRDRSGLPVAGPAPTPPAAVPDWLTCPHRLAPPPMAVSYPRKILNSIGPREVMGEVVKERKLQVLFLNS